VPVVGAKPELRRAVVAQLAPRVWPRVLHRAVFGVGRMTQIATNGFQMWVPAVTWHESCPQPTPPTHIRRFSPSVEGFCG